LKLEAAVEIEIGAAGWDCGGRSYFDLKNH
jgi:hypothetical protein